jgi:hypothetical protein
VSTAAEIPRTVAMLIEAGRLDDVRFGDIRRYAKALGARFDGSVLWQGADLDRMLNRGHAKLHEATATWLSNVGGWVLVPEVSFAYAGDRGVIDIVAWHAVARSLLVIELKTRIVDISDLMATMDIRGRVARRIAATEDGVQQRSGSGWSSRRPGRTRARWRSTPRSFERSFRAMDGP